MELTEGKKAPAFSGIDQDGEKVSLADFKGKKVALYFYPKDDTSGCTKEALAFTALKRKFANADTAVIGVSKDSLAAHAKFRAKYKLGIALGSDPEAEVINAYGAWVEKSLYGRKYMGIERATYLIGRDGALRKFGARSKLMVMRKRCWRQPKRWADAEPRSGGQGGIGNI